MIIEHSFFMQMTSAASVQLVLTAPKHGQQLQGRSTEWHLMPVARDVTTLISELTNVCGITFAFWGTHLGLSLRARACR
jgi:hypothetical protein